MNATEQAYMDRQVAIRLVLQTIKHPMSKLDREASLSRARSLAVRFRMTAIDLLNATSEG